MSQKVTYEKLEELIKERTAQLAKANKQLRLGIIERKQAAESLRETRDFLESLIVYASAPIIVWDPDLKIIRCNGAFERLVGYTAKELVGKGLEILFPPASCEDALAKIVLTKTDDKWESVEISVLCKDAQIRIVLWNSANIYAKDGMTVIATLAQGIDITERKLAEAKIRSAHAELNQIFDTISGGICLIDKNFNVLKANRGMLNLCNMSIDEVLGKKCYETFSSDLCNTPECFLTKILGGEEYITMEVEKKYINGKKIPCILSATPCYAHDGEIIGIVSHLTDITIRKKHEKELKDSLRELRKALRGTIRAMALTVEVRDPYTAGHQQRVADLARAIAKEMGFSRDKIAGIRMAGRLHDIGKIAIPAEIISKPGRLNGIEFEFIKTHPQVGYDILKSIKFPWPVAQIVLQHHERMNGSGYPKGLSGEEILIEARILGIADVVEAMASHRPYRPALGIDKALEEISINKGRLYDVEAVNACLRVFKDNGFKFK